MYCGSRCRYRCRCRFIFGKDERRGDGFSEFELVRFFSKVFQNGVRMMEKHGEG